jgi:uncharacterized membrane protein YgcG
MALIRHVRVVAAVVAAVVAVGLAGAARAAEEILAYDAAVTVAADGVLDVTETIRVRAEGDRIRRGIYRDFPLTFLDDDGRRRRVSFELVGVTRDGRPEPHHTAASSQGIRIYAGEESALLSAGVFTYVFHYRTGRQVRFLPEHTELFWNVTGNEWAFPILTARAEIRLPEGRAPVRWTGYTGRFGERGSDLAGEILGDNALAVATTRPLAPGEGLSVVVDIPVGLVAAPSGMTALYYQYLDNRRFVVGGLAFLGVLVFYVAAWRAVGRDPPKGTIIPLFHPPPGVSPALAAYVRDWGWRGWRAFTAAALSLAVKGQLVFDDSGETIVLSRQGGEDGSTDSATAEDTPSRIRFANSTSPQGGGSKATAPGELPPGERAILKWVDGKGGRAVIDKANGTSLVTALASFRRAIERESRHRFFRRNAGWFVLGLALTVAALVLVLALGDLSDGEIGLLIGVGIVSVFLGMMVAPIVRALLGRRNVRSLVAVSINLLALVAMGAIAASIGASVFRSLPDDFGRTLLAGLIDNGFPFVLIGAFAAMNGLFYYLLRAPTAAGRKVMDDIEGLELYIRTAETARLDAQAPDLDAGQFERLLPYAVALDAERPWSQAFAAAFARAHPGEEMATAYAPAWHGGRGFRGGDFGRSMAATVSAAQASFASATPAPRSSSSGFSSGGGGGGSGGGGGGGGGGGW